MKAFLIIFIFAASVCTAQDSRDSALINLESEGIIVNLQSANFTNDLYDSPIFMKDKGTYINLNLNATAWKFSNKFNIGGFTELIGVYDYLKFESGNYGKVRGVFGSVFGEMDYYLSDNVYTTLSAGTQFSNRSVESSRNVLVFAGTDKGATNYLWGGIGIGRITNTSSRIKEDNFENILYDRDIISSKLPHRVRVELDKLIEERNNKDFISKFKDDADVEFFEKVESLLKESGTINTSLDAGTTIKLYNSLNNDRYLYYPNYSGYQIQAELQGQLFNDRYNHLLTLVGIFGKPLSEKINLLFSGFFSYPLNRNATIEGLFNDFKNPFSNYLPILMERCKLDNKDYLANKEYHVDFSKNQEYFTGGKIILFYKFNEYAGIRGFASTILNKPSGNKINNLSNIGAVIDYNIFSHLTLQFETDYVASNLYTPDFHYEIGFLWNIF